MVNVLHVFILLMSGVFTNSQNIGLLNDTQLLNYEANDIKLLNETICPKPQPCYIPIKYDVKYRCRSDVTCPRGFKCCIGDCFTHKVCIQPHHVKTLQIFESPTKNSSLPKTLSFDISNATLLNDVKIKLSPNLMKIFADETGQRIFNSSESLISLETILPLLKTTSLNDTDTNLVENYAPSKETVTEYGQSNHKITASENDKTFEPKPLTQNYESTEKSPKLVTNYIINIDDAITSERNLESYEQTSVDKDLSTSTIRPTNVEDVKENHHNFTNKKDKNNKNGKQIKSKPLKGIKLDVIQNIKSVQKDAVGFEDDVDYFEGSGDDNIVPSTPYYPRKEYDGSGDYNKGTDEQSKYGEGSGDNEEIHTSTDKNYVNKETDDTEYYNKETDDQSEYEEGSGDNEETSTTSSVIFSTTKKVENGGYKQKHRFHNNMKSMFNKIKNINRVIKTSKNQIAGFEDDVDYSEGSGDNEDVVGSKDVHKENKNLIDLLKLLNHNKMFRHAAHYWKQLEKLKGGNDIEESTSSKSVSSQVTSSTISFAKESSDFSSKIDESKGISDGYSLTETSTISSTTDDDGASSVTSTVPQDDQMTTATNQIPFTLSSWISTASTSDDSKNNQDFIDIDDSTTLKTILTTQNILSKTTLEGSGNSDDEIVGSGNSDDEIIGSGDFDDFEGSGIEEKSEITSSETSKTTDKEMIFSKTESPTPLYSTPPDQNQTTDLDNTFKEYTSNSATTVTVAGGELAKYTLPEKNDESATNNVMKSEKEIQKESSLPNYIFKNHKEESFKNPGYSQDIRKAKAALDMMKESTGNEPDDYYEDEGDNQMIF